MTEQLTPETIVCNCAAIPPTMPTYRAHHLPMCPVWAFENRANVVGEVKEPLVLRTSKKLTRYTPYLNGTAFMGMLKQNETHPEMFGPDHDWTHGPYVLAADADAEVERLTRERDEAEQRVRDIDALWHGQRDVIAERDRLRAALELADQHFRVIYPRGAEEGDYICKAVRDALSTEPFSDETAARRMTRAERET